MWPRIMSALPGNGQTDGNAAGASTSFPDKSMRHSRAGVSATPIGRRGEATIEWVIQTLYDPGRYLSGDTENDRVFRILRSVDFASVIFGMRAE